MKKYLVVSLVLLALVSSSVKADDVVPVTCGEGEHWISENAWVEETTTQGDCNLWSAPECLASHTECSQYQTMCSGPWWHRVCSDVCVATRTVCDEYSESVCLGYATVVVPGHYQDGGQCVANKEVAKSSEGGISLLQYLPSINQTNNFKVSVVGREVTVNFLSNYFALGGILWSEHQQTYAVSTFGFCTYDGNTEPVFGSSSYYGYDNAAFESGVATYHTVKFTVPGAGKYYLRPILTNISSMVKVSNYVLGSETAVNVY